MKRRDFVALVAALLCEEACSERTDGRIVVDFWYTNFAGGSRATLLSIVDEFNRAQSTFRVRPTYQGDYFEGLAKLRTGLAAKRFPALINVVGEVIPYLAEAGALTPLDDLGANDLDLVPELAQKGTFTKSDAPTFAIPMNRSTPVLFYDRGAFRALGLDAPATWGELRDAAKRATIERSDGRKRYGFECAIDWWFWAALVGEGGGSILGDDGALLLGGDAGVRAIDLWKAMLDDDRSMIAPSARDYSGWSKMKDDFVNQDVAMIWTSTAFVRSIFASAKFDVGVAPLPKGEKRAVPTGGSFFVVPRGTSKDVAAGAFAFLKHFQSRRSVVAWAEATGYIPTTRAAIAELEHSFYPNNPGYRVALDQLDAAMPWPWSTRLFRLQREAVQPMLERAVLERKDARACLDEARRIAEET